MDLEFLLQPFSAGDRVGDVLLDRLTSATSFWCATAWAQEAGVDHLFPAVTKLRAKGGTAEAVVGLDQGFATFEGLQRALVAFDAVFLFHDRTRSFHPKLYVVEGSGWGTAVIGSGNLTQGGLFENYEASVVVDLDLMDAIDRACLRSVREYFERFIAPGMPVRRLDEDLLQELRRERVIRSGKARTREEQSRKRTESVLATIFGAGVSGLPRAPLRPRRTAPTRTGRTSRGSGATNPSGAVGTTARSAARGSVVASWWKQLTISDAMRKPATSHQRNYVILGKAGHPIDQKTFFRDRFFRNATWKTMPMHTGNVKEEAIIPFEVVVRGQSIGSYPIRVDHAPNRIANQNNSPTYLNWSSLLDEITRTNYTNYYLLLERLSSGAFRLSLTPTQPQPAMIP